MDFFYSQKRKVRNLLCYIYIFILRHSNRKTNENNLNQTKKCPLQGRTGYISEALYLSEIWLCNQSRTAIPFCRTGLRNFKEENLSVIKFYVLKNFQKEISEKLEQKPNERQNIIGMRILTRSVLLLITT